MAADAAAGQAGSDKPAAKTRPSIATDPRAAAFAELKALCDKHKIYWPASELEGHPVEGYNDSNSLM